MIKRLNDLGLLIDFKATGGPGVKGPAFLQSLDKHITDTLRSRGWIFPPRPQLPNMSNLTYDDLSWRFVYNLQKKIMVPCGGNTEEKRYLLVSTLKTSIQDFCPKTLMQQPFGATPTRPKHPLRRGKPLIYISKLQQLSTFGNALTILIQWEMSVGPTQRSR